jgi:hypothetical protein
MSIGRLPLQATLRAAPLIVAGAVAGAGTMALASPARTADQRVAVSSTTANLRVTRGGELWMSAQATLVGRDVWATRVRSHKFITAGTYRVRVRFSGPDGRHVVRYKARLTDSR